MTIKNPVDHAGFFFVGKNNKNVVESGEKW
jgi:hypothetical protein